MDITEQLTHESRIALAAVAEITRLRAEVEALKLQRTAAELVHRETATTVLMQMAEVESLKAKAAAFDEWHAKTEWVQETAEARELGMHRADVMRKRIEVLRTKAAAFDWMRAEHDRHDPMVRCVIKRSRDRGSSEWVEFIDGENFAAIVLREASIDAARAAQGERG